MDNPSQQVRNGIPILQKNIRFESVTVYTMLPYFLSGAAEITVTAEVDVNGIIKVTAEDVGSGRVESLNLDTQNPLTHEQVEYMISDAETHSQEDEELRDTIDTAHKLVIISIILLGR